MKKLLITCLLISCLSFSASLQYGSDSNTHGSSTPPSPTLSLYSRGNNNNIAEEKTYIFGGEHNLSLSLNSFETISMGTANGNNGGGSNLTFFGHQNNAPGRVIRVNGIGFSNMLEVATDSSVFGSNIMAWDTHNTVAFGSDIKFTTLNNGSRTENNIAFGHSQSVRGSNNIALGNDTYSDVDNAITLGYNSTGVSNAVSVGNSTDHRKIVNVSPADINATSKDLVNGSQLYNLLNTPISSGNSTITSGSGTITGLTDSNGNSATPTNGGNGTIGIIGSSNITTTTNGNTLTITDTTTPTFGSVNVNHNNTGTITGLTNLDLTNLGSDPTRLITESQLKLTNDKLDSIDTNIADRIGNTLDNRVNNRLNNRFSKLQKELDSGVASGLASGILPQAIEKGQDTINLGAGVYGKGYAFALGWSRTSLSNKSVVKVSTSVNNSKKVAFSLAFSHLLENDRYDEKYKYTY